MHHLSSLNELINMQYIKLCTDNVLKVILLTDIFIHFNVHPTRYLD